MLIKSFCVGNKEKSFFIDKFKKGINIINSDDNDKGKTIVSQGIMYCFGNTPCFPVGFDEYRDYYFIIEFEMNKNNYFICRKNDNFFVYTNEKVYSFESVNDFKSFFSKNIISLPTIKNNKLETYVGLELFLELFFMPQDKRSTSNIFNRGRYNKEDFIKMLCSIKGAVEETNIDEIEKNKNKIKELKDEREILKKEIKILKPKNYEIISASYTNSKDFIDEKINLAEKIKKELIELINKKNRLYNRQIKNEILLKEINSLKTTLREGKLICSNCSSDKIVYETADEKVRFDVTNLDIRNQIKDIIEERIKTIKDDIIDLEILINKKRDELLETFKEENLSLENYLVFKKEILKLQDIDNRILKIDEEIENLEIEIKDVSEEKSGILTRKEVINEFVSYMNEFYKGVNPTDPLIIEAPFTKNNINYSGSQGVLYIMSRYYASSKFYNCHFPIIIDDFRDGEISTIKEDIIIDYFISLEKQVILTCTLKDEEKTKYLLMNKINNISFNNVQKFSIMNKTYNQKFVELLSKFNIDLSIQK